MHQSQMSGKPPADPDAVTVLPVENTWCDRRGERTTLRVASWSLTEAMCVRSQRPCPNCHLCVRVAKALNRPCN